MTTAQQTDAYRFFAIAFGAAPGVTYMNQIADAYAAGMTTKQIVNVYTTKPQFTSVYPTFFTNAQFANALIENVVGSSASAAAKAQAKADVEAALAAGWSRGDVIYQIFTNLAAKPDTDPDWGNTAKLLANQVAVAKHYTEVKLGNTEDLAVLKSVIANVTPTTDVSTPAALDAVLAASGASSGQTFTLTTGVDYADSTSSLRNGGLLSSDFKFTSQGETIAAGAGTLNSADALIDPSTSDNDVLNATLTALVAPTLQNIETINLTVNTGGAGLDFTNVSGAKTVTLTGSANAKLDNVDATKAPTIEVKNYTKVATLKAATLAGTKDALTVKVSGMTGSATVTPGITLDVPLLGTGALETLNLESAGTTKNTVALDKTGTVNAVNKTVVTGAADLDLRVAHGLINGQQLDASGHTGALNLIVDRHNAGAATTNLANVSGYDVLTVRDSDAAGVDRLVLSGVTTGSTVVLANAFAAADASIAVKGAASKTNDTLTLVLDHSTDATDIDVNGANNLTISDIETLTIKSEGGTSTGNKIQQLDVTAGTNLVVDGATKLDLGLVAGSKVSTITLQGAGNHKVAFNAAAAYAEGKNLTIDGSAATGKLTIDMGNFQGSGVGVNEKLTITGSAQDDTITTGAMGGQTVVIDAGAGKDTITVAIAGTTGSKTTITTGAGADTIKVDLTGITAAAGITVTDFTVGSGGDVFSTKGAITAINFDKNGNDMDDNELFVYTGASINGTGTGGVLQIADIAAVLAAPANLQKSLLIVINDATGVAEMYYYEEVGSNGFNAADKLFKVATFENITTVGVLNDLVAANFAVF
jgi:hypothetical protein